MFVRRVVGSFTNTLFFFFFNLPGPRTDVVFFFFFVFYRVLYVSVLTETATPQPISCLFVSADRIYGPVHHGVRYVCTRQ